MLPEFISPKLDEEKKTITEQNDYAERAGWGAIREQKNVSYRYIIDNVLSYENSWNKLMYSAMIGHSYEEYKYETFGAYSDNYSNGAFPSSRIPYTLNEGVYFKPLTGVMSKLKAATPCFLCTVHFSSLSIIAGLWRHSSVDIVV